MIVITAFHLFCGYCLAAIIAGVVIGRELEPKGPFEVAVTVIAAALWPAMLAVFLIARLIRWITVLRRRSGAGGSVN